MVALFARLFLKERLGGLGWAAVGASTAGVVLTVGRPGADNGWLGDALVLASLLAVVGWVLLGKRLNQGYPPVAATAWVFAFTCSRPCARARGPAWEGVPRLDLTALGRASVLVLGLGRSAATYALWNWGVGRVPASRAGVFLNVEPLVGALLGVVVLGDA